MPREEFHVRSAIASRFDARPYSGLDLYSHSSVTYTSPTFSAIGEGLYSDVVDYLNGRANKAGNILARRFKNAFASIFIFPSLDITILDSDRIEFRSNTDFQIDAGDEMYKLGFDVAGQSSSNDGDYYIVATGDWERGRIADWDLTISFWNGSSFAPRTINTGWQQDVPSYISVSATADTLESLEPTADYGWFIGDDGHTYRTHVGGLIDTITWINEDFKRYLGYKGTETKYLAGTGSSYIRSTYPCRGFITPSRALARQTLSSVEVSDAKRTLGNGWASITRGSFMQQTFDWWLDGPSDCDDDLHNHWLRYCLPMLSVGMPVVVYQDWGDTRLSSRVQDGSEYNLLITVEDDGYRGRIEGNIVRNSGSSAANWPDGLRRRAPMKLIIEE